jgi:hypothetical protein
VRTLRERIGHVEPRPARSFAERLSAMDVVLTGATASIALQPERNLAVLTALEDDARDALLHEAGDEALTRGEFTQPLERLLRDGALDGTIAVDDPAGTATLLFNVVGWTYRHLRLGHRRNPERATRAIADLALRGVVSP